MKKHFLTAAICLTSFAFAIDSSSWNIASQDLAIISSSQLTELDLLQISEGSRPEITVEFAAGTTLPITFYLSGDLANLAESHQKWGTIEIQQTFYARCVEGELVFSSDLTEWKSFFEFATGSAGICIQILDGVPSFVVGSATNRRS